MANDLVQALHATQQVTVHCNLPSTSTAAHQSMALARNAGQFWTTNEPTVGRVFTADISKVYITNTSGTDAKVLIGIAAKQAPSGGA